LAQGFSGGELPSARARAKSAAALRQCSAGLGAAARVAMSNPRGDALREASFPPESPWGKSWGAPGRASEHTTACGCLPLRTAVFLSALGAALLSLVLICSSGLNREEFYIFTGGYTLQSRVIIELIEMSGLVWGVIGMVGAVNLEAKYVRIYLYFQIVRLFAWLPMYFSDVPLLWGCELLKSDIKGGTRQFGFNKVMYKIAFDDRCEEERALFAIFSSLALVFYLYVTLATCWLLEEIEEEPRYLLQVPRMGHCGAFYTQSLGGRVAGDESRPPVRISDVGASTGQGGFASLLVGPRYGP